MKEVNKRLKVSREKLHSSITNKHCFDEANARVTTIRIMAFDYFKSATCVPGKALDCSNGCEVKTLHLA